MNKINKDEVNRILELAMLKSSAKEVGDYVTSLNQIVDDISKIQELEINSDDILINPINNVNYYDDGNTVSMIEKEDILKHISNREGDYVLVPKVIE